jgi:MFS family permease
VHPRPAPITKATGVTVDDVAKRLIDYGFHAPTMSFPVPGTLMIEPTESRASAELDRFCDAMIAIRAEIDRVAAGRVAREDNPLRHHAPHTAEDVRDDWDRPYTGRRPPTRCRGVGRRKYWPPVAASTALRRPQPGLLLPAALPAFDELSRDFGLDARGLSPAITGTPYFVGMAIGQLIFGVLADRFGRRPIMMVGLSVYALGALGAATANGLGMLLVGRFVWGIGAAAPAVLRMAIARDLYAGERMARVVSLVTAVFLIGPIVVPFIGEWILLSGSWRAVFAVAIALAAVALAWAFAFGETLAPEHRQPLRVAPIRRAFAAVVTTRVTLWAIIAQAFFGAAFFIWLGSAQPVIDRIYGRSSQFTLLFGLSGVGMAAALLVNKPSDLTLWGAPDGRPGRLGVRPGGAGRPDGGDRLGWCAAVVGLVRPGRSSPTPCR